MTYLKLPTASEHGHCHFGSKRLLRCPFSLDTGWADIQTVLLPFSYHTSWSAATLIQTLALQLNMGALLALGLLFIIIAHLDCNLCGGMFHINCGKVAPTEFRQMQRSKQKSRSCPTYMERQFLNYDIKLEHSSALPFSFYWWPCWRSFHWSGQHWCVSLKWFKWKPRWWLSRTGEAIGGWFK